MEQRNSLLKNMAEHRLFDRESIEVWNIQLVDLGHAIFEKRKAFLDEFIPVFQKHYNAIGLEQEEVELEYKSQLHEHSLDKLLEIYRSEEHTSELQSHHDVVCRLLLEKKN